jgi:hypothetical protein
MGGLSGLTYTRNTGLIYSSRMRCGVVELFSCGVKRSSAEVKAAAQIRGNLLFATNPPNHGCAMAWLKQPNGGSGAYAALQMDGLNPLLHAELAGINGDSLVIRGIQRRTKDGVMHEEQQAWWVRF